MPHVLLPDMPAHVMFTACKENFQIPCQYELWLAKTAWRYSGRIELHRLTATSELTSHIQRQGEAKTEGIEQHLYHLMNDVDCKYCEESLN